MRQAGHMAHMGEEIMHIGFLLREPEVDRLEELRRDGRKILKWILKE
jgi:hypothetical protein